MTGLLPYPHARNDCDGCRERDADMHATYARLQGRPLRWCRDCAGPALAALVSHGHEVHVAALEVRDV